MYLNSVLWPRMTLRTVTRDTKKHAHDLLDGAVLFEIGAPYLADLVHANHPHQPFPTANTRGDPTEKLEAIEARAIAKFWQLVVAIETTPAFLRALEQFDDHRERGTVRQTWKKVNASSKSRTGPSRW